MQVDISNPTPPADDAERNRRLWATLRMIEANPLHHRQSSVHCGTSHCYVGFSQLIAAQLPAETDVDGCVSVTGERAIGYSGLATTWAAAYHGINLVDIDRLFYMGNRLADLRRIVHELTGGDDGSTDPAHLGSGTGRTAARVLPPEDQDASPPVPRVRRKRRVAVLAMSSV